MWFVDGTHANGTIVTNGPFGTFEEAELWAATHDYADYFISDWDDDDDWLDDLDWLDGIDDLDEYVA